MTDDRLTIEDVREMDEAEINANWTRVSDALASNRHRDEDDDADADTTGPDKPVSPASAAPMSWQTLNAMSADDYRARADEVEAFISRGSAA